MGHAGAIPNASGERTFGELLRRRRLEGGLTQAALAERAGISTRALQDLERGVSHPHRDTLLRVVRALELSVEDEIAFTSSVAPPLRPRRLRGEGAFSEPRVITSGPQHNLPVQLTNFVGRQ